MEQRTCKGDKTGQRGENATRLWQGVLTGPLGRVDEPGPDATQDKLFLVVLLRHPVGEFHRLVERRFLGRRVGRRSGRQDDRCRRFFDLERRPKKGLQVPQVLNTGMYREASARRTG